MIAGDTCSIRAGTYRETVVPANSGTPSAPITFQPYGSEVVTISGAEIVTGWTMHSGGIYKASFTGFLGEQDQVFVDGWMMNLARWPNSTLDVSRPAKATTAAGTYNTATNPDGTHTGTYSDPALTQPAGSLVGARVHMVLNRIIAQTGLVTNSSPGTFDFTWRLRTVYVPTAGQPYYLFGRLSLLDTPGEWFIDSNTGTLYL